MASAVEPLPGPEQVQCELERSPGFGYDPPLPSATMTWHEVRVERDEQMVRFRIELACALDKGKRRVLP